MLSVHNATTGAPDHALAAVLYCKPPRSTHIAVHPLRAYVVLHQPHAFTVLHQLNQLVDQSMLHVGPSSFASRRPLGLLTSVLLESSELSAKSWKKGKLVSLESPELRAKSRKKGKLVSVDCSNKQSEQPESRCNGGNQLFHCRRSCKPMMQRHAFLHWC